MLQESFEKVTARLVMRPYRAGDYQMWRETFLNLPEAQNIWDQGPRDPDDLTRAKFEALLESARQQREREVYYSFIAFEKATGCCP